MNTLHDAELAEVHRHTQLRPLTSLIDWSEDNGIVTSCYDDDDAEFYIVSNWNEQGVLQYHFTVERKITALAWGGHGLFATGNERGEVSLYPHDALIQRQREEDEENEFDIPEGGGAAFLFGHAPAIDGVERHGGRINCLGWSPDKAYVITGSIDGTIKMWDGIGLQLIHTISPNVGSITSLTVDANFQFIMFSATTVQQDVVMIMAKMPEAVAPNFEGQPGGYMQRMAERRRISSGMNAGRKKKTKQRKTTKKNVRKTENKKSTPKKNRKNTKKQKR